MEKIKKMGAEFYHEMTIPEILDVAASKWPEREAVVYRDQRITFGQLKELAYTAAKGFHSIGVSPGDHVGFIIGNYPEFVWLQYALILLGAKAIPINVNLKADEIKFILQNADVSVLLVMDRFREIDYFSILQKIISEFTCDKSGNVDDLSLPKLRKIIIFNPTGVNRSDLFTLENLMELGRHGSGDVALPKLNPADYAYVMFTSGTTAFPKGAMQSHRTILEGGYHYGKGIDLNTNDKYLCFSPFYHVGGLISGLYSCHVHGAALHLTEFFQPDEAALLIDKEKITAAWGLGVMFLRIMESAKKLGADLSSFKKAVIPTGGNILERIVKELQLDVATNSYAMTEGGIVSITPREDRNWEKRRNSHGKPVPGIEVRIVDHETRKPVGLNAIGEICFAGWNRFLGYYNMPEETDAAIDEKGFFYTEDMGRMDEEGYLYWCGRYKEVIKTGGENVSQLEVETFLEDNTPWIKRAGVVGVPDKRWGEAVTAIVQLKPNCSVTAEEMISYVKGKIADFKVPKHIIFIEENEWPLRPTKKLDKMKIREMAIQKLGIKQA
ncbi:MAG: class I adenylate-forming enzyme family protein [Syntrophales bacterium]|nr:class I adenylate-forming enzyme family protein [Syntrophales bacterium]